MVEAADRLLPSDEPEASRLIAEVFAAEGIGVHTRTKGEAVSHDGNRFTVRAADTELTAERLLVATGRRSDLAWLCLASLGLDTDRRSVETDQHRRIAEGVYAIGDITDKSMYQAGIVTRQILGHDNARADYHRYAGIAT